MARPAASYRGARKNRWHRDRKIWRAGRRSTRTVSGWVWGTHASYGQRLTIRGDA